MSMRGASLVLLAALVLGVAAHQQDTRCGECDRSACPPVEDCPGAEAMDSCGCCVVCQRSLGQRCDVDPARPVRYGPCGAHLTCTPRSDIRTSEESSCECVKQSEVCGSDNITYPTFCHFLDQSKINKALTITDQGPCFTKPVIKTAPQASRRRLGGILVLDCEAVGYPVPEITWELYKPNGLSIQLPNDDSSIAVQVRGGPEHHMVTGWVQIMKVTKDTVGIYVCNAKNSQGSVKATAAITLMREANEI